VACAVRRGEETVDAMDYLCKDADGADHGGGDARRLGALKVARAGARVDEMLARARLAEAEAECARCHPTRSGIFQTLTGRGVRRRRRAVDDHRKAAERLQVIQNQMGSIDAQLDAMRAVRADASKQHDPAASPGDTAICGRDDNMHFEVVLATIDAAERLARHAAERLAPFDNEGDLAAAMVQRSRTQRSVVDMAQLAGALDSVVRELHQTPEVRVGDPDGELGGGETGAAVWFDHQVSRWAARRRITASSDELAGLVAHLEVLRGAVDAQVDAQRNVPAP
jgi:hypothetical protein